MLLSTIFTSLVIPIQVHPMTHSSWQNSQAPMVQAAPAANLQEAVKSNEHQLILSAIQNTDSRIEAARVLGISPRTLRYKMARLKLETSNMAMAG